MAHPLDRHLGYAISSYGVTGRESVAVESLPWLIPRYRIHSQCTSVYSLIDQGPGLYSH